jgi:hypothetical protein
MFRRELILLGALVIGAFAIAFAGAWYVAALLQREVASLTTDTLPSLANSGAVRARVEENWGLLQSALRAQTHEVRTNLVAQIENNSVDPFLRDFESLVNDPQEQVLVKALRAARSDFVAKRGRLMELVQAQRLPEAVRFFESEVTASYGHYQAAAKVIFQYEMEQGAKRGAKVSQLARLMPWLAGGLGLGIFLAGTFFGLKAALGGLGLVSRLAAGTAKQN